MFHPSFQMSYLHSFVICSLTQVHEETGILLTKPMDLIPRLEDIKEDVKEINDADILEAVNITKERAKLRKAQLQAQAAIKDSPIPPVDGTGVIREDNKGTTWKVTEGEGGRKGERREGWRKSGIKEGGEVGAERVKDEGKRGKITEEGSKKGKREG